MPKYYSILDNDMKPKPKAGPRKEKPKPAKGRKISFGPAVPTPKRASKDAQTGREMPKRIGRDPWGDKTRKDMEMPKVMGSTKAQRADSAREMLDNMRSRNLLRSRKSKKRGL